MADPILYPPFNSPVLVPSENRLDPLWVQYFVRLTKTVQAGGSGPAPADAQYVLGAANASLPNGRLFVNTTTVAWDLSTVNQVKANVPDGSLTYAKLQNETNSTLLGRGASGTGPPQEITLGTNLSMSGTTLNASGGVGTVTTTGTPASGNLAKFSGATSITNGDLSGDVTTSGTLAATLANTAVTPGTYGDGSHVGQFTVDSKGRLTFAANVAITGGASGYWSELTNGDPTTPVLIFDSFGNTIDLFVPV